MKSNKFSIYDGWAKPILINDLIEWLEEQKKNGNNTVEVQYEYGYYKDIDDIKLISSK